MRLALLGLVLAATGLAQSFEVATVKETPSDWTSGRYFRMESPHRFVARNFTVKLLIGAAYNANPKAISGGPVWIDSDRYDIAAVTPGDKSPTVAEQMTMLRKLLEDRFALRVQREPKEFSIYALTVAKGGPKLRPVTPGEPQVLVNTVHPASDGGIDRIQLPARNASITEFVWMMQRAVLDRPVVDRTGLTGPWDFDLEWTPDDTQFGGALPPSNPESHKPDLFAALQEQVGLRLESTRGPVDTVVIDHVEKPTAN